MREFLLLSVLMACGGNAFSQQTPPALAPTTCDSTRILSVENFASGSATNGLGGISRILWCDFEFPAPTTPVTSVLVHGQPAFITLQDVLPTSPVTSVIFHGYPSYVPRQIVAQLPISGVPVSPAELDLVRGAVTLASTSIKIEEFAPGIFTLDRTPGGLAIVLDATRNYIGDNNPARPGEAVTVLCEGMGPTTPSVAAGVVPTGLAITTSTPSVFVGSQMAPVIVSTLATDQVAPAAAGVYEVTFIVPSVSAGSQPIYLSIGGHTSNTARLVVVP